MIRFLEILIVIVPGLLSVAFMTIIERKAMASMQRRIGPNIVGIYGVLQPFADALKLILKETVIPQQASAYIFILAPVITIIFSLLGWAVIPFGTGLAISDMSLGVLYSLAVTSIGIYGILLAGWAANSKYAFLGSLRSTAQMISYELVLSTVILIILLLSGSFNYFEIIESQKIIWNIVPMLSVSVLFIIAILAETNRTPFDLPEAESELVAGFFTEHSAMPFVLYFLAEYCSIVIRSVLGSIYLFGGFDIIKTGYIFVDNLLEPMVIGIKTSIFCFIFVWFRATLPRLRYDQLMNLCWLGTLPIAIARLILVLTITMTTC